MTNKIYITGICLLLCHQFLIGQTIKDTINCSNRIIVISLPSKYNQSISNYEEGFLKTYTFTDGSNITINCGSMIKTPLLNKETYIVTKTKEYDFVISRKGKNENAKYWREDNYNKYSFDILYNNVDESNRLLFDNLLDSLKISRIILYKEEEERR